VGRVTAFRDHLRWWDARPLFGRRVLVTRPREQAAELVDQLVAMGAEAIEAPMIRIEPPHDVGPLLEAAHASTTGAFDWIVFTSGNGVEAFMTALLDGSRDLRALGGVRVCAVGTGTAERLARYGLKVDLIPKEFRADAVAAAIAEVSALPRTRVLIPRGDIGRDVVADELRAGGAAVTDVIAYRTVLEDEQREGAPDIYRLLLDGTIDVVTFTSASAVRNFVKIYGEDQAADLLKHTIVAAIGPVTADAASQLGIEVRVQPATYTVKALVTAITEHVLASGSGQA
jgi:uroporphyrinogen III methyltransferase/synthase